MLSAEPGMTAIIFKIVVETAVLKTRLSFNSESNFYAVYFNSTCIMFPACFVPSLEMNISPWGPKVIPSGWAKSLPSSRNWLSSPDLSIIKSLDFGPSVMYMSPLRGCIAIAEGAMTFPFFFPPARLRISFLRSILNTGSFTISLLDRSKHWPRFASSRLGAKSHQTLWQS